MLGCSERRLILYGLFRFLSIRNSKFMLSFRGNVKRNTNALKLQIKELPKIITDIYINKRKGLISSTGYGCDIVVRDSFTMSVSHSLPKPSPNTAFKLY